MTNTIPTQDTASCSLKNNYLVLPSSSDISPVALLPFQHLPESSASLPGIENTYSNTSSLKRSSRPTKANTSSTRRNTHSTKGARQYVKYIDECYLWSVIDPTLSNQKQQLAHLATLTSNLDSGDVEYTDPWCYVSKLKLKDNDSPSCHETMHDPHSEKNVEAMKLEVSQLVLQNTWEQIPRSKVNPNYKFLKEHGYLNWRGYQMILYQNTKQDFARKGICKQRELTTSKHMLL